MLGLDKHFLRGSIPPLVTPFKNGEIDYDTYAGLVEFQRRAGSHGILCAGARFEPPNCLREGDIAEVEVEGVGTLKNRIVREQ